MASSSLFANSAKHLPQELKDVFFRIKGGLPSYVSYLSACGMFDAFSEYVLYEPILRILKANNWHVETECEAPGVEQPPTGDKKRIDFVAKSSQGTLFALEVKWVKAKAKNKNDELPILRDVEKLAGFKTTHPDSFPLVCVFGQTKHMKSIKLTPGTFKKRGQTITVDVLRTRYSCAIYELRSWDNGIQTQRQS